MPDESARASELDKLRAAATSQLSIANSPEAIEAAGRILAQVMEIEKLAADTEKTRAERQKLEWDMSSDVRRMRSDERKQLASLLAPVLTTVVLAGTLVLQTYQTITTEHDKHDAADEIRWADTLKSLSVEIKGISPGSLSLITFFASPRYSQLAKQASRSVLLQTNDLEQFRQLFTATYGSLNWTTLDDALELDKQMLIKSYVLLTNAFKKLNDKATPSPDEQLAFDFYYGTTSFICSQIAPVLRSPRPTGFSLDMRHVVFYNCDLSDANLNDTKLDGFSPSYVTFSGVDFRRATGFDNVAWKGNVWWLASKMDADMLEYLRKNFPYDPQFTYWNNSGSQQEYENNLRRLSEKN